MSCQGAYKTTIASGLCGGVLILASGAAISEVRDGGPASEIRVGLLKHDHGIFSEAVEDGYDINLELLFHTPSSLAQIGSPRPFVGAAVNTKGNTDQLYFGLDWDWDLFRHGFAALQFGGTLHNGDDDQNHDGKALGCPLLFRIGADIGYRFDRHHALMLHLDHISNASLCDQNDGMEAFGIRYGYRF